MKRFTLILSLFLFAGCGRTPLDDFTDGGGPPRRDGGELLDGGGRDGGRDGGGFDGDVPECRVAADCDDGLFCNGAEQCRGGVCLIGPAVVCDDGVDCTEDRCSEPARGCESIPDGSRCPAGEVCEPGIGCVRRPCRGDDECQDRFICNGSEACVGGLCRTGMPPFCDDGVACTADECSEAAGGCISRPDDRACSDRQFCNGAETCVPGAGCVPGRPMDCNDFDRCTFDSCNESFDRCDHGPVPDPSCMPPGCPDEDLGGMTGMGVTRGTTATELNEVSGSCGGGGAPEHTVRWTAPSAGSWTFDTRGSMYDTLLYVLSACGGPELPGACDDDSGGTLQSSVTVMLSAGQTVIIVIDGFGSNRGAYQLNIGPGRPVCESFETSCVDGIDNDCDRLFDCADNDCRFRPICRFDGGFDGGPRDGGPRDAGRDGGMCAPRELGVSACTDRRDNDCDGPTDCRDSDCSPFGAMWECCNGLDDDGDGLVDVFTCRCTADSQCRTVGSLEQVCWTETYSVCAPRCNFYGGTAFCRMYDPALRCDTATGHCVF